MIVEMALRLSPAFFSPRPASAGKQNGSTRSGKATFRRLIDRFDGFAVLQPAVFIYPQSVKNVNQTPSYGKVSFSHPN
jgi:hypothetical protein